MTRTLLVLLPTFLCFVPPAFAQVAERAPVPHNQTVSANPFGLIYEWFNAEYERKLTPTSTWAVSGSMFDFDNFNYRNVAF